ncbi:MAG TPA: CRISPR-associated protein Csx15 [Roseiflexaceae bacterium]|nr:CRISPR-associated protein Csx15 [Roseiflexaceae bacterium]
MILLNYAHPLTAGQLAQIAALIGETPEVRSISVHIDRARPGAESAVELADAAGLAPDEWQTTPLILNPPGLAPLALALIAEIHGRCGYFPPILNIRPVEGALPPRYEVAEVINLQLLRDAARRRRVTS